MGNLKSVILLLVLFVALSGCYEFEMRGFVTSYENVNERFEQSQEWNRQNGFTQITVPESTYSILAMGDSHIGGTRNFDTFIQEAKNINAAATVFAGDITTGHDEDYKELEKHLPAKDSLMYFAVVGNHDLYFDGWKNFYSIFGSTSYYFVVNSGANSDLFICLDTGGATLGSKQLSWLKNLLETERSKYRYCTVITHNNLFRLRATASTNPMAEEIQAVIDMLIRHNINMVITAHDHKRNTNVLGKTTNIIMDALQDSNNDASYLKLTFSTKGIDYSFVDL